jgi:hypothetical protein
MSIRRQYSLTLRTIVVVLGASCGWLLYCGSAWIVHHDSVNYRLHDSAFAIISDSAETAFALGPVVWTVAGVLLALPLLLGCVRRVISFWELVALHVLAYLILVCGIGSISTLPFLGLLGATMLVWILAVVRAGVCPNQSAQQGAAPNGGPATRLGNSGATERPPSVS